MSESLKWMFEVDAKFDQLIALGKEMRGTQEKLLMAGKSAGKTEDAIHRTGEASKHAAGAHDRHSHSIVNLGHQYEYAKNGVHEFAEALGLVLAFEGVEFLVDKVKELGGEILNAASKAERLDGVFSMTAGGKEVQEFIEANIKTTEFSGEVLKGYGLDLLRVGMSADKAKMALLGAMDVAAMGKDKMSGLGEAVGAFANLERTGKTDNRRLKALGFGEKDFRRLDQFKNMSKEQLAKAMESGSIGQNELFQLIEGRTHSKYLGTAAADKSTTMDAKLTHLKDAPEEFFRQMAKGKAFEDFKGLLDNMLAVFDPESPKGKRMSAGLEKAAQGLVGALKSIDIDHFANTLLELFGRLPKLIQATADVINGDFKKAVRDVGGAVPAGADTKAYAKAKFGNYKTEDEVDKLVSTGKLRKIDPQHAGSMWKATKDAVKGWFGAGEEASDGFGRGLDPGKGAQHGEAYSDGVQKGVKGGLKIKSPSKVFEELGARSGEGFMIGLGDSGMEDTIKASLRVPSAGNGGRSAVRFDMKLDVNVNGGGNGDGHHIGQQVASKLDEILPGALQIAFEQMQIEAGA